MKKDSVQTNVTLPAPVAATPEVVAVAAGSPRPTKASRAKPKAAKPAAKKAAPAATKPAAKHTAKPAKAADDLAKKQQDAVRRANVPQPLQIPVGRDDDTGRPCHRLHNHRRNVAGGVQVDQAQQVVGQFDPVLGHALDERARRWLGVRQMVGLYALTIGLSVAQNAAHRDATEVDTVVALLAPDQQGFAALPFGTPVRSRHFQRGIGRFRP